MVAASAARLGRTWPQRLLITFNVFLIVVCLLAAGGLGYFWYRFGQLPRIDFAENILTIENAEDPGEPQNWLLVGSDTRAFVEGDQDAQSFGTGTDVAGQRADTIILLRIDPRAETAAMLSFPRDLWVPIAGTGRNSRINTAFEGGPEQLILTIRDYFNVPIHHYAQVDFAGFKGVVDAVGGVEVFFPAPARDTVTGLNITDTGCVELAGEQALAFVRSRHFQYQENGRWKTDPTGDLGRITRQQDFIRRAIREALSKGLTNPVKLNDLVTVGIRNVQIDDEIDARDILRLGSRFKSLDPASIEMATIPAEDARVGGAAVLKVLDAEAQPILDRFRGVDAGAPVEVSPSEVRVRVLNGSGTAGQATSTARALSAVQFQVAGVGNASHAATTTIRYGTGEQAKAVLVARYLEGPAQLVEDPALQGVDVELTTGADFVSILDAPKPPEAVPAPPPPPEETTTTTAPPAEEPPAPEVPQC